MNIIAMEENKEIIIENPAEEDPNEREALPSEENLEEIATSNTEKHAEAEMEEYSGAEYDYSQETEAAELSAKGKTLTKFDIWERKLLDFSLRNALLNLTPRRRAVQLICFDAFHLEETLENGTEYRLGPTPDEDTAIGAPYHLLESQLNDHLRTEITEDMERQLLHTFLPKDETRNVLKNIHRVARNTLEESGANSLFLAVGTLRWYETQKSVTPRYAPILLLPIEILYKKGGYYIRTRDEEISLNITLMEFLRQNYDIDIKQLDQLPTDERSTDVERIFTIIREAVKDNERWDVEEECILGIFSFSKFLMWKDVHVHREQLAENQIISSLLANRLTWTPETTTPDLRQIDRRVPPSKTAVPVQADSSQMAAIIEGGEGHSFIIFGPPGTGKSQTITNLIANALYQGKRVLFVAEKMAALSVVQNRLEKIGLDPFCLELHSNKATKRHVLRQLEKALKVTHIKSPLHFNVQAEKIFKQRMQLLDFLDALHTPDPTDGLSPYDCIIRAETIEATPLPRFTFDKAIDALMAREGEAGIVKLLGSRLQTTVRLVGQPSMHPLNGLHVDRAMLMEIETTTRQMKADSETLKRHRKEAERLREAKGLLAKILRDNSADILKEDPEQLRLEWRKAKAKWLIPRYFAKKNFHNKIKEYNPYITLEEIDQLIDDLITYTDLHARIKELNTIIYDRFGIQYEVDEVAADSYLEEKAALLTRWATHTDEMRDWLHWTELRKELRDNGMGCVADTLEAQSMSTDALKDSFLKALMNYKAREKTRHSEILATFEGMLFDDNTSLYRQLTEEFQQMTRKELYARLASRVPRMTGNASSGSEIGLLNRNISNGGRGMSMRDLFDQLPTLMPRLCPVMLMSPMSVAQYIDIKAEKFDLVIFDEASQMPTSESVGAIARGKSLIVVGDPKQMPPTSFFTVNNVDEDEASIDDMESILEDCRTLEMPSLQLSWHYRSRHESLIAFSNNEYYGGTLITFPSVDDNATKLRYIPVERGYYEKGGRRCNEAEAEAIVEEIARRLRSETLRQRSIGVIAFSIMQQGLIEDLLQERLEQDRELQEAATGMYEPIFVKNLENVQGDERDVILFSIGYGPDKDGKVSMNFGPLNNTGGERRLNVAVSRARMEMLVFSTLRSADIDLRRSKARGVEGLKHFLQYAETHMLRGLSKDKESAGHATLARQIAAELEKRGYKTAVDVGRSQFKVDVAVESIERPGTYELGILLDGPRYRDTLTTRDREIVQPSVLQGLDWKVMRVWSIDWFRNKERVIGRIIERLNQCQNWEIPESEPEELDLSDEREEERPTNAREYIKYEPHFRERKYISDNDMIRNIIAQEQPITFGLLCRRYSALHEERITQNLQKTIKEIADKYYTDRSGAIWLSKKERRDYQTYRTNSGRLISEIPKVELFNVLTETLQEQVSIEEESLIQTASRKIGFTRTGVRVEAALRNVLEKMKKSGKVEEIGYNLRMSSIKE